MTQAINYKFKPLDAVQIVAYGLDYRGRVQECITSASGTSYCVEYAADGKIEQRRFYEDELETPQYVPY